MNAKEYYPLLAKAKNDAVNTTIDMVIYVLQSKHGFTQEDTLKFYENMANVSEMVSEGRLNIHDIRNANMEEIGVITRSDI